MARRPRRSVLEKLQDELLEVQATMEQYEEHLAELQERQKEIEALILSEQTKDLMILMEDHDMSMEELKAFNPAEWRTAMERMLTLLQENRTIVLNVYRAYERSYVEHDLRQWATPLVEARVRLAAGRYRVTEDQIGFMAELLTQGLASIVLSWVERGMPSSVIERLDDFDILVEGCLDYTMERLAQKNRG